MAFLYTLGIRFYGIVLFVASWFVPKAKSWVEGRKNWRSKLPVLPENRPVFWFHCASLGEFDQGLPVMNLLREKNPDIYLLVTFFSPSGMEHYHKRSHSADFVCYLPLDTPTNARDFVRHFKPQKTFFVKYEFWIHYILEAKRSGSQMISISAIFREDHRFFKPWGSYFRKALHAFDQFFVQTEKSKNLLASIGIDRTLLVGDTRFDRVIENKKNVQADPILSEFTQGKKAFVIGSSWSSDEELLASLLNKIEQPIVVAPHDISESHLIEIEKRFAGQCVRYSVWKSDSTAKILLIDCIGKLANAYSYGEVAYVGGGFSGSLHNILEPAVFGLPVLFGPKHTRFPEAEQFIENGIGFSVTTPEELFQQWQFIQQNKQELAFKTSDFVESQSGASQKIISWLEKQ